MYDSDVYWMTVLGWCMSVIRHECGPIVRFVRKTTGLRHTARLCRFRDKDLVQVVAIDWMAMFEHVGIDASNVDKACMSDKPPPELK